MYPFLVGLAGLVTLLPSVTVWELTAVPLFELNVTVYENGNSISIKEIRYTDGTYLCSGTNSTVNTGDIAGVNNFIVILNDGTQVNAILK